MAYNPFDVTQVHKGPQAPKFAPPAAAASAAAAAQAPAEAPAPVIEETVEQDVYQAGEATATVDTPAPVAAQVELPPQVQELKERIEGAGSHREELQDDLDQAISCFEEGEYAEAADLLEAIQAYLDLREEISSATGISQARKTDLRQKAWQEYQGIAEDVRNGEPLAEFTTTREALLDARLDYYQGKHWGAGFTDFLENIETAIENGNFQAAEALLQFCDTILAAKKMIKQLTTVINNDSIPQEVRDLYAQARAQLRAEVEDILAGNLGQAQEHAERAQQKLAQAQGQIAEINAAREAEVQAAYAERAGYLIDNFGPNTDIFAGLEEALGEDGGQLCSLFEIVEDAREDGHFDEAALEALDKLSQLLRAGAQAVNRQQIFAAADQLRDYLAQLSQAQGTGGTLHLLSVRAAAGGTVGFGMGLASFAKNGTALTALAEQQTIYQRLEMLSASHDPEDQAAYQALVAELLDLDACQSIYDLSVLMDNFLYLRETGHLPPSLQSVQAQNAFLQRIAQHPVVQQSLNDIETGKIVQIVESIVIVIVAAATAEIGGGAIAAELGIGGGAGGFLLTQAIVAPIFTLTNGFISQGMGLSEGWETPVELLENMATDYLMFVTLGAVAKGYAMLFRAPTTPVGKLFYQGGSFAAEYLAFNGFTFAEQAVGSAFSEELTLSYVFSSENVQQVFMDNAVMLIGLKIGNFIAKPIISPLREGILERSRPDLAQEARQLEQQGQALAERLADFQINGGTGEQYLDIRADQISQLQARVDFLKELKESGFATEAEVREAEAALESATTEYARLQEARVEEATIEPVQAPVENAQAIDPHEDTVLADNTEISNSNVVSSGMTAAEMTVDARVAAVETAYLEFRRSPSQESFDNFVELAYKLNYDSPAEAEAAWQQLSARRLELFRLQIDETSEFFGKPLFEIDATLQARDLWHAESFASDRLLLEEACRELGIEPTPENIMSHLTELQADLGGENALLNELGILSVRSQAMSFQAGLYGGYGVQAEWVCSLTLSEEGFSYDLRTMHDNDATRTQAATAPGSQAAAAPEGAEETPSNPNVTNNWAPRRTPGRAVYQVVVQDGTPTLLRRGQPMEGLIIEVSPDGQFYKFMIETGSGERVMVEAGLVTGEGQLAMMGGHVTYDYLVQTFGQAKADEIMAWREVLDRNPIQVTQSSATAAPVGPTIPDGTHYLHQATLDFEMQPETGLAFRFAIENAPAMEVFRAADGKYYLRDGNNQLHEIREGEPILFRDDPANPASPVRLTVKVENGRLIIEDASGCGIIYSKGLHVITAQTAATVAPAAEPMTVASLSAEVPDLTHINDNIVAHEVGTIAPGIERPAAANGLPGSLVKISGRQVIMVGDLHGNVENLNLILAQYGDAIRNGEVVLVFLGDAIHPETGDMTDMTSSIQLMDAILNLKAQNPDSVFYLQGNHDETWGGAEEGFAKANDQGVPIYQGVEFKNALLAQRGQEYVIALQNFYENAPLALIVEGPSGTVLAGHAFGIESNMFNQVLATEGSLEAALINARNTPGLVREMTWTRPGFTGDNKNVFDLNGFANKFNNADMKNTVSALGLPASTLVVNGHSHNPTGDETAAYAPKNIDNNITLMSSYDHSLSVVVVNPDGSATVVDLAGQSPVGGMTFGAQPTGTAGQP